MHKRKTQRKQSKRTKIKNICTKQLACNLYSLCLITSIHKHTHIISVSLMCQGRNPSVLSTGPNFSTRSGSGMFFDSAQREKTGISGKSLRSFWRWILRTLQALLLTENILETIETVKKVLNNRSVSQHNISSRMSELQSQRSDDAHIVAIRGCAINILHHSDGLNCTFSIVPRYLTLSCSWYRHILFYFCKWILVWYIQHYCNYYKKN